MGIQDGTYVARPGQARVYENDNGSLVLCMEVQLEGGPVLKSYHTLAKADGTLMTRTIDNLKAWSGWDGTDPFWFTDTDLTGFAVEVVIENQPGRTDPGKMYPTVKWVNPPGGGGSGMAESGDRRAILAKYGGKLRANAGGVPAERVSTAKVLLAQRPATAVGKTAGPAAPPSPVPARPVPRPPAAATAAAPRASDMNTCWARMCDLCAKMPKVQVEQEWFAAVGIIEGKDQADLTPEEWGRVEAHIVDKYGGVGARAPGGAVGRTDGAADADDVPF